MLIPTFVACSAGLEPGASNQGPGAGEPMDPVAEDSSPLPVDATDLQIIGEFEGSYDGKEFIIRPRSVGDVPGQLGEGVGQTRQAVLDPVPSQGYGTGIDGTGTDQIAIEQQERVNRGATNTGTWPSSGCGLEPSLGLCVRMRLRNLFDDVDISRAYIGFTEVRGTNGSTVLVASPGAGVDTSVPDWGVTGVSNGVFRYGNVSFLSPLDNGPEKWWLFQGVAGTTGNLTFTFTLQVYGKLQRPTVRASLANGTADNLPYYSADGTPGAIGPSGLQLSSNGQYAVFASSATNLHPSASAAGFSRIFRRNLATGATEVASLRVDDGSVPAAPAGCQSTAPSISNDGRYVAFQSSCVMDAAATYPQAMQVYLRDMVAGTTAMVSHAPGDPATGAEQPATAPTVAGGGAYVVFQTAASNVIAGRPSPRTFIDLYRWDRAADVNVRANVPNGLSALDPSVTWPNNSQLNADISDDGRLIVFESQASNLVLGDAGSNRDIFLYLVGASLDSGTSTMLRMSTRSTGAALGGYSFCERGSISGDGSAVAMVCRLGRHPGTLVVDPPLVPSPTATYNRSHVYVRDSAAGSASSIRLVDASPDGLTEGNAAAASAPAAFSPSSRLVAYSSAATNLTRSTACSPACLTVPGGAIVQVFVHDRFATDPSLRRSFVVSLVKRVSATALPNYSPMLTANASRFVSLGGSLDDNLFVAYSGRGAAGTDWSQMPLSADQLFVSPVGDFLFQ